MPARGKGGRAFSRITRPVCTHTAHRIQTESVSTCLSKAELIEIEEEKKNAGRTFSQSPLPPSLTYLTTSLSNNSLSGHNPVSRSAEGQREGGVRAEVAGDVGGEEGGLEGVMHGRK